jgi:hypothetical protein
MKRFDDCSRSLSLASRRPATDNPLPTWIYIEAVDAFRAATDILLRYVRGWVFTKGNPELVQKRKHDRDAQEGDA